MNGTTSVAQKTYAFGSMTIAVRTSGVLKWVLTDHLGSTSITANADGSLNSEIRYSAFGEVRYSSGITPTDYQYTNQLNQPDIGLYYYVARFYDPVIAHFVQADTIVPNAGSSSAYDRYAYVLNNPIRLNDPSGHIGCWDDNRKDPQCQGKTVNASGIVDKNPNNTISLPRNNVAPVIGVISDAVERTINETTKIIKAKNLTSLTIPFFSTQATFRVSTITTNISSNTLKNVGRGFGFIGWVMTVAPAQIENAQEYGSIFNVPSNHFDADLYIDTGIFLSSTLIGGGAAALAGSLTPGEAVIKGVSSVVWGVGASAIASNRLDQYVKANNYRDQLTNLLYEKYTSPPSIPGGFQNWNPSTYPNVGP